ncbi:MAG: polyribonucleotide nucleotidyltransferase [Armatimonadota bacterium]|nr:polyribonucleotide nucleotidyltransferase [Armatimonadota bacterium]MDR5703811.1 polyribonucleotide nucleotidyltransferase [Armatimonadota bacterium]
MSIISSIAGAITTVELEVAGRKLSIETGRLAKQANGSVLVRYGDTVVLVTACASAEPRPDIDFLPLTVDLEEKMYAAGKIPGGFFKREGRPGERAILSARLIDRPIRPLFPKGFRNDVQVIATVLSADQENAPDLLGLIGASAALSISDIPWNGPIGAVRIGLVNGEFVINPTLRQIETQSALDLVVAAAEDGILMVEAGAKEIPEERILDALDLAFAEIKRIIAIQRELVSRAGKPKREVPLFLPELEVEEAVRVLAEEKLSLALRNSDKVGREEAIRQVERETLEQLAERFAGRELEVKAAFQSLMKSLVRRMILHEGIRPDGRTAKEIRPVSCDVGLLPRVHGSGFFQRGQTQVLTTCTLGTGEDEQILDDLGIVERKRFMHHYYMPPYSTGEVRPLRSPGRREIGHGALAERALAPLIPPEEEFPYTIRLVSEVLESNGSTSMASVCGSSLALMDAGVPIKSHVGGIAMGLITDEEGRVAILTDIQGIEDAMGDMDFKVAGTRKGITALQMDIKVAGLSREVMAQALAQAREAREFIIGKMEEVIRAPRPTLSPFAPRITTIEINPEKIREVIGPGGKMINKIIAETGVKIEVEQDGKIHIASPDEEANRKAVKMIEEIVREVKVGEVYIGRVTRVTNFGAFVEVLPGKEGLVHISELSDKRVDRVEDVVKVGEEILVKVKEIDAHGRINLTRRGTLPQEDGQEPSERPQRKRPPRRRREQRPKRPRREGPPLGGQSAPQ